MIPMFTRRAFAAAFLTLAVLPLAACGDKPAEAPKGDAPKPAGDDRASWPARIVITCIPDGIAANNKKTHEAYAAHLTKVLGVPVEYQAVTDYSATVDGLVAKKVDFVWYGGFTSVQAILQTKNAERLATRAEDLKFKSVFIRKKGSPIASLADLKGKTFTFGSNSSTSGHLMPRHFLAKAGLEPTRDFAKYNHSKNHDETIDHVAAGVVEAGALNYITWNKRKDKEGDKAADCEVFWTTPEYVDYCWVGRKDLPAGLRAAFRDAFLALDPANPEHKAMLDNHGATKFVPCPEGAWNDIEAAARAAGMLKD